MHQSASDLKTPTGRNQTSSPLRWRQGQFGSQWLRGGMALKIHETNSLAPEKCGGGGLAKAIDNFVTIFIIDYSYCYSFCLFFLLRISSTQSCCFEYLLLGLLQSNFKFQQQASGLLYVFFNKEASDSRRSSFVFVRSLQECHLAWRDLVSYRVGGVVGGRATTPGKPQ